MGRRQKVWAEEIVAGQARKREGSWSCQQTQQRGELRKHPRSKRVWLEKRAWRVLRTEKEQGHTCFRKVVGGNVEAGLQ